VHRRIELDARFPLLRVNVELLCRHCLPSLLGVVLFVNGIRGLGVLEGDNMILVLYAVSAAGANVVQGLTENSVHVSVQESIGLDAEI